MLVKTERITDVSESLPHSSSMWCIESMRELRMCTVMICVKNVYGNDLCLDKLYRLYDLQDYSCLF